MTVLRDLAGIIRRLLAGLRRAVTCVWTTYSTAPSGMSVAGAVGVLVERDVTSAHHVTIGAREGTGPIPIHGPAGRAEPR